MNHTSESNKTFWKIDFNKSNELILLTRYEDAECLDIRTNYLHEFYNNDQFYQFVYRSGNYFYWGPSVKYGFHCFNDLQDDFEDCEDFEYRIFKDCDFL